MFYVWFGIALYLKGKMKDAHEYLKKAMKLGEESGDEKVEGYACTWLAWTCVELGLFVEGIGFGEKAQKIARSFPSDQYLYFKSLMGLCYIYYFQGDVKRLFEGAIALIGYGNSHSNSRSMVFGHWANGFGYYLIGNMDSAQKSCEKSIEVAMDPFYSQFPKISLALAYLLNNQVQDAKDVLQSAMVFFEKYDIGQLTEITSIFLSLTLIAEGKIKQGFKKLEKTRHILINNQRKTWYAQSEYILGKLYSQIATGPKADFSIIAKNIGFLVKNIPHAGKKAEEHFNKAIEISEEIGAKGFLGMFFMDLGLFHKARNNTGLARKCILKSIDIFEERGAEVYLKQAHEELGSMR